MIKVDTGTMGAQVSSVSSTVANRVTSINTAIQSLNQLLQADNLQGNAYTGAKGYASQVLIPLLQALMMYSEAVSTYTTKNQTLYSTYFSDSQDSEQLNRDKERINSSLRIARETARILAATPLLTGVAAKMAADFTIMLLESELRRVEEKVQKLERFNAQSAYTFSDIASLQTAVMQGLAQVDGNFGSFSSNTGFSSFLTGTPTWAKTVNSQWEKRTEAIRSGYDAVLKKVEKGEALTKEDIAVINAYAKRHPDVKPPKKVVEALDEYYYGFDDIPETLISKLTDMYEWGWATFGKMLDDANEVAIKQGKNLGRVFGAKLQPRDALGRFVKDRIKPRSWLSGKLKGMSNGTSKIIGHGAKILGFGVSAFLEGADHYSKYKNAGRAVSYGITGGTVAAGAGMWLEPLEAPLLCQPLGLWL